MFDLHKKSLTLSHVNGRHEKHGDDNVLAADLKFIGKFSGDVLAEFAPTLRSAMFTKAEGGDLADQGSDVPTALRFKNLCQPLKFSNELVGAAVTLEYGLQEIIFDPAKVNSFALECFDGGTVKVTFRVQVSGISQESLARCFMLLDTLVPVTIVPPEEKAANDDDQRRAA